MMDTGLSPDFYEDLASSYLRVATVANSKFYISKDFERAPAAAQFTLLSSPDPEILTLWAKLKQCKSEDVVSWCDFDSLGLIIFWCWIRARTTKISLQGHMKILESYFNEYKQSNMMKDERSSISDKMSKYVIGSCFKKMYRRAFHWASSIMVGTLTFITWDHVAPFPSVVTYQTRPQTCDVPKHYYRRVSRFK